MLLPSFGAIAQMCDRELAMQIAEVGKLSLQILADNSNSEVCCELVKALTAGDEDPRDCNLD